MTIRREFYGWKLVAVLWLLDFMNMGFPLYGGAVINTYMLKEIPMSRSTFGLGFTLLNLFVGLPAVAVGDPITRWGIRRTFAIGSAVILLGAAWMAVVATQPWQYLLGFGVLVGTGISFGTIVPVATAITRWFRRYRGRMMAVALSASGFAGFFGAPLTNQILTASGGNWRQAWTIVMGIAVASAIVAFMLVKERPEDLGQEIDGGADTTTADSGASKRNLVTAFPWTPRQAFATRSFWMIVVGGIACHFPFFFFTAHWLLHLKGAGIGPADAAWAMGLFTMGAVAGRLIGGLLMVGSVLALRVSPDALWIAYAATILYGTGFGWTFVCLITATGHFYGPAAFPKVNGLVLLLTGIFGSPAGVIGGGLFDLYGNYTLAFAINMAIAAVGIIAMLFATKPDAPREMESARNLELERAS